MASRKSKNRLTLADLVDLELQLHRDQAIDPVVLRERDAKIGAAIGADRLSPPAVFTAWFAELREQAGAEGPSAGERSGRLVDLTGTLLLVSGLLLGIATMALWLAFDTQRHINVVFFWTAMVGIQILLLGVWLLAALPSRWLTRLPGGVSIQMLCRGIGRIPTALLAGIGRWISPEYRKAAVELAGDWRRIGWLYGDLQRWTLVRLTQVFAVAFNVGALLAFLALTYGNDPTFGWRSTMLTDRQMHRIMEVISLPWSRTWPGAVPSLEQVAYVKYSSKENVQHLITTRERQRELRMWASLWPFLLASLCWYGLFPRLVTWSISAWQVHRRTCGARLDHFAASSLLQRLRRPVVVSAGSQAAEESNESAHAAATIGRSRWGEAEAVPVFQWAGVDISEQEIARRLAARFGITVAWLEVVGQLDPQQDERAVAHLIGQPRPLRVVLLVEAWEPPDADYLDFLSRLREALGADVPIAVVLYNHHGPGHPAACQQQDWKIWRQRLSACGDPYLGVDCLIDASAEEAEEDA
jgi:hypothetical protein